MSIVQGTVLHKNKSNHLCLDWNSAEGLNKLIMIKSYIFANLLRACIKSEFEIFKVLKYSVSHTGKVSYTL